MARHGSASLRKHESHANSQANGKLTKTNQTQSQPPGSIFAAGRALAAIAYDRKGVPRKSHDITPNLKRRARRICVDGRVAPQTRHLIRYALDNRDPYLVQLVTRVERGEMRIDQLILDTD